MSDLLPNEDLSCVWTDGLTGQHLGLPTRAGHQWFPEGQGPRLRRLYGSGVNKIGAGSFGVAVRAIHAPSNTPTVLKLVKRSVGGSEYSHRFVENDLFSTLLTMRHPNVVRYLDFLMGATNVCVVMEPLEGPELFDRIAGEPVTEAFCRTSLAQMLRAVAFVHARGLIHRDVKLESFRYRSDAPDAPLVLFDFGLCCEIGAEQEPRTVVGTLPYMAPELAMGLYSELVDVWALGICEFMMLTARMPLEINEPGQLVMFQAPERHSLMTKREHETALKAPELAGASAAATELLSSLLAYDASCRPRATEALECDWFAKALSAGSQPTTATKNYQLVQEASRAWGTIAVAKRKAQRGDDDTDLRASSKETQLRKSNTALMRRLVDSNVDGGAPPAPRLQQVQQDMSDDLKPLEESEVERVAQIFDHMDRDGSGSLDEREIVAQIEEQAIKYGEMWDARNMVKAADSAGTGRVSKAELIALLEKNSVSLSKRGQQALLTGGGCGGNSESDNDARMAIIQWRQLIKKSSEKERGPSGRMVDATSVAATPVSLRERMNTLMNTTLTGPARLSLVVGLTAIVTAGGGGMRATDGIVATLVLSSSLLLHPCSLLVATTVALAFLPPTSGPHLPSAGFAVLLACHLLLLSLSVSHVRRRGTSATRALVYRATIARDLCGMLGWLLTSAVVYSYETDPLALFFAAAIFEIWGDLLLVHSGVVLNTSIALVKLPPTYEFWYLASRISPLHPWWRVAALCESVGRFSEAAAMYLKHKGARDSSQFVTQFILPAGTCVEACLALARLLSSGPLALPWLAFAHARRWICGASALWENCLHARETADAGDAWAALTRAETCRVWTPVNGDSGIFIDVDGKPIAGAWKYHTCELCFAEAEMSVAVPGAQRVLYRVADAGGSLALGDKRCVAKRYTDDSTAQHVLLGLSFET